MEEIVDYNEVVVETCSTRIIVTVSNDPELVNINELDCKVQDECFFYLTLGDIISQLEKKYETKDLLVDVWYELGVSGTIYRYGNYGPYWLVQGTTRGSA